MYDHIHVCTMNTRHLAHSAEFLYDNDVATVNGGEPTSAKKGIEPTKVGNI